MARFSFSAHTHTHIRAPRRAREAAVPLVLMDARTRYRLRSLTTLDPIHQRITLNPTHSDNIRQDLTTSRIIQAWLNLSTSDHVGSTEPKHVLNRNQNSHHMMTL